MRGAHLFGRVLEVGSAVLVDAFISPGDPESIQKVKEVKRLLIDKGLDNVDIEIDGGINAENLASVLEAGVNVVVAGSAVFKNDASENVKKFKEIMSLY